jgi:hypothetical protein
MSDHFKFEVSVCINDQWHLEFEEKGQEIKDECAAAVRAVLEKRGYNGYREDYWVGV